MGVKHEIFVFSSKFSASVNQIIEHFSEIILSNSCESKTLTYCSEKKDRKSRQI
jgi:hypothetical protein